jgi:hypothetical protein
MRQRAEASVAPRPKDHTVKREEECRENDSRDEQPLLHVPILRQRNSAVGTVCTPLYACLHVDRADPVCAVSEPRAAEILLHWLQRSRSSESLPVDWRAVLDARDVRFRASLSTRVRRG